MTTEIVLIRHLEEKTGQYVSWHASGGIRIARQQADLDWFLEGIADNVGFRMEIIDPAKIKSSTRSTISTA